MTQVTFPSFGTAYFSGLLDRKEVMLRLIVVAPPVPHWFNPPPPAPFPEDGSDEEKARWQHRYAALRDLMWPGFWATEQLQRHFS